MLYALVRPIARYTLARYFRHIDLTGLQHIPPDAPVILAANHPTAFIEPCLMACFQRRPLHFLARGDFFRNPIAGAVLRALHILPVYRQQDGEYGDLTRNYATFDHCYGALNRGRALMILAEGRCVHERRLRPLRKGTARVALGALHRHTTLGEVYIVPVGVNFSAPERLRSTVMIRCGAPLRASDYLARYRANEATGLRELTDDLHAALGELVVQLPGGERDAAYQTLLEVRRNAAFPHATGVTHAGKQLDAELAALHPAPPHEDHILRYAAHLHAAGLRDAALLPGRKPDVSWQLLPALLLALPQLPLWVLAEVIALRGPRRIEFYSPVRFAALAVGQLLYVPLLFVLPWWAVLWIVGAWFGLGWCLRLLDAVRDWRQRVRFGKLPDADRRRLQALREALL